MRNLLKNVFVYLPEAIGVFLMSLGASMMLWKAINLIGSDSYDFKEALFIVGLGASICLAVLAIKLIFKMKI